MRVPILLLALLAALTGCDSGRTVSVSIADPWIRLPAVAGQPAAGYVTIAASPDHGALIRVSSPRAGRIEIHETEMRGSMAGMKPVDRISFADEREIVFEPGGRHLMLFDLDPKLMPLERAELVFHFEKGAPARINAVVVGAGDPKPDFSASSASANPEPPCKPGMTANGNQLTVTKC